MDSERSAQKTRRHKAGLQPQVNFISARTLAYLIFQPIAKIAEPGHKTGSEAACCSVETLKLLALFWTLFTDICVSQFTVSFLASELTRIASNMQIGILMSAYSVAALIGCILALLLQSCCPSRKKLNKNAQFRQKCMYIMLSNGIVVICAVVYGILRKLVVVLSFVHLCFALCSVLLVVVGG